MVGSHPCFWAAAQKHEGSHSHGLALLHKHAIGETLLVLLHGGKRRRPIFLVEGASGDVEQPAFGRESRRRIRYEP